MRYYFVHFSSKFIQPYCRLSADVSDIGLVFRVSQSVIPCSSYYKDAKTPEIVANYFKIICNEVRRKLRMDHPPRLIINRVLTLIIGLQPEFSTSPVPIAEGLSGDPVTDPVT
jgi:hypothetical protein